MNNKEPDENNPKESFSDDPQENFAWRTKFSSRKRRPKAAPSSAEMPKNLPPDVENEFLRNVQVFEEAWKDVKYVKGYDFIGRPPFRKAEELADEEIESEVKKLHETLNGKTCL